VCTEDDVMCLGVTMVAAGNSHSCAVLTDHTARCWGKNDQGQLGTGDYDERYSPVKVKWTGAPFQSVVPGGGEDANGFTCAVHLTNEVSCWGSNFNNSLGTDDGMFHTLPAPVEGLHDITVLALGFAHVCAIHQGGAVSCWGDNVYGPMGAEGTGVQDIQGLSGVLEIAAGARHTCARTAQQVLCWGHNEAGQCGQAPSPQVYQPTPVPLPGGASVTPLAIATGYYHSCAVVLDGQAGHVYCWGDDECAQVGGGPSCTRSCAEGTNPCAPVPTPSEPPGLPFFKRGFIGAGADHTCFVTSGDVGDTDNTTHQVYCWGRNDFGQVSLVSGSVLGMGKPFVEIPAPNSVQHANKLSVGPYHACTISDTGVRCWGRNDHGQLGNGTTDTGPAVGVDWQQASLD
jgi:alpha-tubulin suppressor-like RCC1 family protein